ncbi:dTDP-glucose pyrophosphorylase [Vibrio sp. ER1A]|uniref:dTDP-glucose pyrophosphorylase n=1 Tax=Vibrio sp. ER1A TaxID=1517681 RepID=UPI0004DCEAB8|nr:dTDP-glucose pyrophosphorylase [Vibrio sp. ER1A]KFA98781.1 dTDP-glucose pyrophosphorylase [Vibrio sp. ER1A]
MAIGVDEKTGILIEGSAELKQRLQRCMKTRLLTLPLGRDYGSDLPRCVDGKINAALKMDIYAGIAKMLAHPPNGFIDEIKLNQVWIEQGANEVSISLEVTRLFDGKVEEISGLGL